MHRRTLLNLALGAALILLAAKAALACFWDRDTLAQEAEGLPGVVEVLLGRIDRWPPEYYAMRLERVTKELEADPINLALYDDAAVASDRLKLYEDAIEWMAKKRAILDTLPESDPTRTEHEYRYLANLGTHHAHRWIANGGSADDLTDLNRAIELIRAAIDLNPDAHFGREKVQLGFLEALLYTRTDGKHELRLPIGVFVNADITPDALQEIAGTLPAADQDIEFAKGAIWDFLTPPGKIRFIGSEIELMPEEAIKGLVGLMVLGDAWSSIDVHESLTHAIVAHESRLVTGLLGSLRAAELGSEGTRSILFPDRNPASTLAFGESVAGVVSSATQIERYFDTNRAKVDHLNAERLAFIQSRLAEGMHPDTHADFWDGFREKSLPPLPGTNAIRNFRMWLVLICLVVFGLAFLWARRDWRRGRRIGPSLSLLMAGGALFGIASIGFNLTYYIITLGSPQPSERWQSYDAFRAAMQSNQP